MYNINQIESTLKYGKTLTTNKIKIVKCLLVLQIILNILLLFIGGIYLGVSNLNKSEIILICCLVSFCLGLVIIVAYCYNRAKRRNIEIGNWLQDAVECKAQIKRLDIEDLKYQSYQIGVEFDWKGKTLKRISNKFNLIIDGYPKIFATYHNKNLNILYSEKYDEVMILKQ